MLRTNTEQREKNPAVRPVVDVVLRPTQYARAVVAH
jgi:hypothetical protein